MATAASAWIEWAGGDQPVADDVMVEAQFRASPEEVEVGHTPTATEVAAVLRWDHTGNYGDVLAYRTVG